jgi:hypothetical protein
MRGGDISNETPPRVFVTLDVVSTPKVEMVKVLGLIPKAEVSFEWDMRRLQQIWNITNKYGLIAELVAFNYSQEEVDKMLDQLDEQGINPFNYGMAFKDTDSLVEQLPYRFNVRGVVDVSEKVARYGSWGIEIDNL